MLMGMIRLLIKLNKSVMSQVEKEAEKAEGE